MSDGAPRRRILAVDDQPEIRDLLEDALSAEGYEVRSTGNPVEALRWIRDSAFDAVILDVRLPAMDGIELHRRLEGESPEAAGCCLFISGVSQSRENLDYVYTHGGAFLAKPFRLRDLVHAVREMLGPG